MSDYPETYPDTRQDYYGGLLQREAEASVRLDGETQDVGPVTVHDIHEAIKDKEADNDSHVENDTVSRIQFEQLAAGTNRLINENHELNQDVKLLADELENEASYILQLEKVVMNYQADELAAYLRAAINEKPTRIRVFLSRQLTWSEVEQLTTDHHVLKARGVELVSVRVGGSRRTVYVDAWMSSRPLFDVFAKALDAHFANVHPSAVATLREYNGDY